MIKKRVVYKYICDYCKAGTDDVDIFIRHFNKFHEKK